MSPPEKYGLSQSARSRSGPTGVFDFRILPAVPFRIFIFFSLHSPPGFWDLIAFHEWGIAGLALFGRSSVRASLLPQADAKRLEHVGFP